MLIGKQKRPLSSGDLQVGACLNNAAAEIHAYIESLCSAVHNAVEALQPSYIDGVRQTCSYTNTELTVV